MTTTTRITPNPSQQTHKPNGPAKAFHLLQALGYDFKLNETDDSLEVNGQRMTDQMERELKTRLRENNFHRVNVGIDAVFTYAVRYHPVREHLNSCSYDGGNYIAHLATFFDNPDGTFEIFLRRWLIGSVQRVYKPMEQNRMLVIDGPQNIGKSRFVEWLAGEKMRRYYREGSIDPDNKDHHIALAKTWIWNVSELGATTRRKDREALKAFLTQSWVSDRAAFGHYELNKPALTSFIGTVNDDGSGFLNDPTGSRRFMFCHVDNIDWRGYTRELQPEQVWSEAVMLYIQGEPAELTTEEKEIANLNNENYRIKNPLMDLFFSRYEVDPSRTDPKKDYKDWFQFTQDMVSNLQADYKGTTDKLSKELAGLLRELGCTPAVRRRIDPSGTEIGGQQRGYYGVHKFSI